MGISVHRLLVSFLLVLLWGAPVLAAEDQPAENPAAEKPSVVTQRDFATRLIQALELGSMPSKVKDQHLQNVLSGRRTLVVEAEDHYDKKRDQITFRAFNTLGEFTGRGWLGASADPTSVTFRARIPLAGIYRMKIRGSGNGQLWSIGGKAIKADCGPRFKDLDLGTVILDAELATFNVMLPPDGAIDAITFTAPDLHRVEPSGGWQFDAPLTYGVVAEAAVMVMKNTLPLDADPDRKPFTVTMAGNAALPSGVSLVTDKIYGKFLGEGWFRNGYLPAKLELPFQVDQPAYYRLKVLWMGDQFIGTIDGVPVEGKGKPYLDWLELGIHHLAKGKHQLRVELSPGVGINAIELTPLRSGAAECLALLGWKQPPGEQVKPDDLEGLIKDLAARYLASGRK